ncbi:MAG: hypothetical protein J6I49_07380 [Bacteroidales bacterium]|nr:hypothetical protein [Bacteroidales bacterium]
MKKITRTLAVAGSLLAVMGLASCDSKLCYCYEYTASNVFEQEAYTNTDTPCRTLSRGDSRVCVERNERMPIGDIAYK